MIAADLHAPAMSATRQARQLAGAALQLASVVRRVELLSRGDVNSANVSPALSKSLADLTDVARITAETLHRAIAAALSPGLLAPMPRAGGADLLTFRLGEGVLRNAADALAGQLRARDSADANHRPAIDRQFDDTDVAALNAVLAGLVDTLQAAGDDIQRVLDGANPNMRPKAPAAA
jgi:hypothetical protein